MKSIQASSGSLSQISQLGSSCLTESSSASLAYSAGNTSQHTQYEPKYNDSLSNEQSLGYSTLFSSQLKSSSVGDGDVLNHSISSEKVELNGSASSGTGLNGLDEMVSKLLEDDLANSLNHGYPETNGLDRASCTLNSDGVTFDR